MGEKSPNFEVEGIHIVKIIETAGTVVVLIFATLFILFRIYGFKDDISNVNVSNAVYAFEEKIVKSGYIDRDSIETFSKDIFTATGGYGMKINLRHTHPATYPLKPSNPSYTIEKPYMTVNYFYETPYIYTTIQASGIYKMNKGDTFMVEVVNKSETQQSLILRVFGSKTEANTIYAKFSGSIKNEEY